MNRAELNKIISSVNDPKLSPFGEDLCSRTRLDSGELLNLVAGENSLLLYLQAERLGSKASEYPELFEELLADNFTSGQSNNLRIAYDKKSSAVLLCYDLPYAEIQAQSLELKIKIFVACTAGLKQTILSQIENAVLAGPNPHPNLAPVQQDESQSTKAAIENVLTSDDDDEVLRTAMMNQEVFLMA